MIILQIIFVLSALLYNSYSERIASSEAINTNQKGRNMDVHKTSTELNNSDAKYFLEFKNNSDQVKPGEEIELSFLPKNKFDNAISVELETIHEKKIHLIIVSDDLDYFEHIHPVENKIGEYSIETNLPYGGNYKLFAEYKPAGNNKITDSFDLFVRGDKKSKMVFENEKLRDEDTNLYVRLQIAESIVAGKEIEIPVLIEKDGEELNALNLDNFLGEKAHAVVIGISDFDFLHVHPMVMKNQLHLHVNFEKSGYYRLWLQFKLDGILHTADFVLEVEASNHSEEKSNHNQHKH